jgi:hypothetical protein
MVGKTSYRYARVSWKRVRTMRSPDLDLLAGGRESARDQTGVIADTTYLRWVFAGYYVPGRQLANSSSSSKSHRRNGSRQ